MKSSFSNPEGNCWHIEQIDGEMFIWSDTQEGGPQSDTVEATRALFDGIKAGEFDHLVQEVAPSRLVKYSKPLDAATLARICDALSASDRVLDK